MVTTVRHPYKPANESNRQHPKNPWHILASKPDMAEERTTRGSQPSLLLTNSSPDTQVASVSSPRPNQKTLCPRTSPAPTRGEIRNHCCVWPGVWLVKICVLAAVQEVYRLGPYRIISSARTASLRRTTMFEPAMGRDLILAFFVLF